MRVDVYRTFNGIPFWQSASLESDQKKEFVVGKSGPQRSVITVDGHGQVTQDKQTYVAPHDMVGEVGGFVSDGQPKVSVVPPDSFKYIRAGRRLGLLICPE
ncbi:hypothetical protein HY440_02140 [Candidatus Microgenomates bacterium]|nr:hypothetical protein [Candidatus Microgenomates bacterium]